MNIGFRVFPVENRVDKRIVEEFQNVVTPHISDNMSRLQGAISDLRPYHKGGKLVGTAVTVKTRPGDNLMVHKAIDLAQPGDVIVVDAGGDTTNAIVGEIMQRIAKKNGIAGFVIYGAIRDSLAFKHDSFPIYAKGVTHRGPYKDGPGEINVRISLGGMIINPGDLIVGDEDGLIVVPIENVEEILQKVKIQAQREEEIFQSIEQGTVDRSWVDSTLKEKGCEIFSTSESLISSEGH
ncbi:4-hydroxy-4-methyl-2-oxoglutarate aldolase/4-carboxy-4-hydroxy-2-oxoadipate aldolase [Peribacillus simplex]|uniref:RraA family protein n=1 Tax=Peribacillus simplex TaxID=1478 RepID=UPI001E1ADFDD|nr:RraA family protein [Peribacillus simplex]MED4096764.1 RraA family protein [Peribacillus simplex]CAH0291306.1 4-hydroxy-4-methyl-2-oxoglutarate aldolase/4-carboxy-4-hydroxy-2-oxoadipate aldolase [Peribacillus simplex]